MRMARVNVYLPDDLAEEAKAAGLSLSGLTQEAVRKAIARHHADEWLDHVAGLPATGVSHDEAIEAVTDARDDFARPDA